MIQDSQAFRNAEGELQQRVLDTATLDEGAVVRLMEGGMEKGRGRSICAAVA